MHKKSILVCISAILYAQLVLFAGDTKAAIPARLIEDSGAWFHAVAEGSLKRVNPALAKVRVWVEGQSGFDQAMDHWYTGLLRIGIGYSITNSLTVWAGYTYTPIQNLDYNLRLKGINVNSPLVGQQDLWPAFRYVLPTDIGSFIFRTLWESNFGLGSQVRERPRQLVKFIHPFDFEQRLSFIAWDEAFFRINTTNWGGKSGFDQNRVFVGFGWSFNSNFRIELGYINQYISGSNHTNNTIHHLGMASLFVNF
jgi:hypothetical protein